MEYVWDTLLLSHRQYIKLQIKIVLSPFPFKAALSSQNITIKLNAVVQRCEILSSDLGLTIFTEGGWEQNAEENTEKKYILVSIIICTFTK